MLPDAACSGAVLGYLPPGWDSGWEWNRFHSERRIVEQATAACQGPPLGCVYKMKRLLIIPCAPFFAGSLFSNVGSSLFSAHRESGAEMMHRGHSRSRRLTAAGVTPNEAGLQFNLLGETRGRSPSLECLFVAGKYAAAPDPYKVPIPEPRGPQWITVFRVPVTVLCN